MTDPRKMINLRYRCDVAYFDEKEARHAQVVMKELGIDYKYAIPQTMGQQWWFWDCSGNIENLPSFIKEMDVDQELFDQYTKRRANR